MKYGFKRSFIVLMLTAVPLVYAQPVSSSQDFAICSSSIFPAVSVSPGKLLPSVVEPAFYGTASWYSKSDRGIKKRTANKVVFNHSKRTCASWDFPFGTRLLVTNLSNGRSVICLVNDRGPSKKLKRLVDLTKTAFREIADLKQGLIRVSVIPLQPVIKRMA